jgi:hypothetical protein
VDDDVFRVGDRFTSFSGNYIYIVQEIDDEKFVIYDADGYVSDAFTTTYANDNLKSKKWNKTNSPLPKPLSLPKPTPPKPPKPPKHTKPTKPTGDKINIGDIYKTIYGTYEKILSKKGSDYNCAVYDGGGLYREDEEFPISLVKEFINVEKRWLKVDSLPNANTTEPEIKVDDIYYVKRNGRYIVIDSILKSTLTGKIKEINAISYDENGKDKLKVNYSESDTIIQYIKDGLWVKVDKLPSSKPTKPAKPKADNNTMTTVKDDEGNTMTLGEVKNAIKALKPFDDDEEIKKQIENWKKQIKDLL